MAKTSVIDDVMSEIINGCKTKARREVAEEVTKLRRANKSLTKKLEKAEVDLQGIKGPLVKREKDLVVKEKELLSTVTRREKAIRLAAGRVVQLANKVEAFRNMKVSSFAHANARGWNDTLASAKALAELKKSFAKGEKKVTAPRKPRAVRRATRRSY